MDVRFYYGKMQLEYLPDVDILVCPTDTHCSGSGGLDLAIHQAAGPGLKAALAGRHLKVGETFVTDGFDLSVKHIVHAAVPKASATDAQAESLRNCYSNILSKIDQLSMGGPYGSPVKSAAITLLGTGFCGWSYEQSMAALWSASLKYNQRMDNGYLQTLVIYYPPEVHKIIFQYQSRLSQAFFHKPAHWVTRGDLYLWFALMEHFDSPRFDQFTLSAFIQEIQRFFHQISGEWLCGDTQVYVKELDRGGMSSGQVSAFMAKIGIPFLCGTLCSSAYYRMHGEYTLFLPVVLKPSFDAEYSLNLPYEILPELAALKKKKHEVIVRERIALDQEKHYFPTVQHYRNAPGLIDFYSLDVEKATDSHYHFSEADALALCKRFGYGSNHIEAVLRSYLKAHGGAALEALIRTAATKTFHYDSL